MRPPSAEPGLAARWTTTRNGAELYAYLLDALPAAGFTITGRYPGGEAAIITFVDSERDAWQVAIYGRDPLTVDVRSDG